MKKEVGLWVDHRKAVIVSIKNMIEETHEVKSNMEKRVQFSNGQRFKASNTSQGSGAEDMRDRQFEDHLGRYYEEIISLIHDATAIWIFGPGEAKRELENHMKHDKLEGNIVGIETADKLTERQITAKVRNYFSEK